MNIRSSLKPLTVICFAMLCQPALAQTADEMSLPESESVTWVPFGDARLRYERTEDIPARADDIDRVRARARVGSLYLGLSGWELGMAAELAFGSDDNVDSRRNKDNERADDVNLDQAYARYSLNEQSALLIGKASLTMQLSPLVWDADLRPVGVSLQSNHSLESGSAISLNAGYFAPDFIFDDEKTRLTALQAGFVWHEGQPTSVQALLSYLDFSKLDVLARNGVGRTNRRLGPQFLSDYELLDLQLILNTQAFDWPLRFAVEGVQNLGADDLAQTNDLDQGGRSSIVLGDMKSGGFEFGFAYQRAQRDAVLSAAADDDWWFQSFARGGMPWIGYGFSPNLAMRVSAFDERRDQIAKNTKRVLLDLTASW